MPDYYWPTPRGHVVNRFGGPQGRAPGMTGTLPASNVGVDVGAPAGDPVTAPAAGVVKSVYHAQADRDVNENFGYGGQVVIAADDGTEHWLSHLARNSITIKPGQRVTAGVQVAAVGATGNTNDGQGGAFAHVDWEWRTPKGHRDPTTLPLARTTDAPRGVGLAAPLPPDQGATPMSASTTPAAPRLTSNTLTRLEREIEEAKAALAPLERARKAAEAAVGNAPSGLDANHPVYKQWQKANEQAAAYAQPESPEAKAYAAAQKRLRDAEAGAAKEKDDLLEAYNKTQGSQTPANKAGDIKNFATTVNGQVRENVPHQWVPNPSLPLGGEWQPMEGQPGTEPKKPEDPAIQATNLATAQANLAAAQQRLAEATSPEARERARLELEAARVSLSQAQATLGNLPSPQEAAASRQAALEASQASTRASTASAERTEALTPFDVQEAQRKALTAQKAQELHDRLQAKVDAAMANPDPAQRIAALREVARETAAFEDPTKLETWAQQEADREQRKQEAADRKQQADTALAENRRQADAQAAQKLADVTTQRQSAFNQQMGQFEQTGVATAGRVQGLDALRQPLPEEQVAAMLGGAPTDPRIQGIYRAYRHALGAPLPAPPAAPAVAPAPAPTPAPMPAAAPPPPQPAAPIPAAYQQIAAPIAPVTPVAPVVSPTLAPVTLGPDGIPIASLRMNRYPAAYAAA